MSCEERIEQLEGQLQHLWEALEQATSLIRIQLSEQRNHCDTERYHLDSQIRSVQSEVSRLSSEVRYR